MTHATEYLSLINKLASQAMPKANIESRGYRIDLNLKKLKTLSKSEAIDSLIAAYGENFNALTLVYDRTSTAPKQAASATYQPKIANVSGTLTLYDAATNHPVDIKKVGLRGLGHKFSDDSGVTFEYLLANVAQPPDEFAIKKAAELLPLLKTPVRYLKTLPVGEHLVKNWEFTNGGYKKSRIVEFDIVGQGIVIGNDDLTKTAQAYNSSWDRKLPATLNITGHGLTKTGNVVVKAFLNLPDDGNATEDWSLLDALSMDDNSHEDIAAYTEEGVAIPF